MLFNSFEFIIFFPIVLLFYALLPKNFRWILLLISSYIFYMFWIPEFILLIIFSTITDYFAGLKISTSSKNWSIFYLSLSLFINLGLLIYFKYFNFIIDSINNLINQDFEIRNIILPMGISFYTFQTLSYSIDVYRKKIFPEKHFGIFALYVSFFPQLVAGPIERSSSLIPELLNLKDIEYKNIKQGILLMIWGFFKKMVIADNISLVVNNIFSNIEDKHSLTIIVATIMFAYQIYCDFSGYTDIARGSAKIFGINLMINFKRPYLSTSIKEFWSRWHISLSTWFRDYIFIPLGGSRVSLPNFYINILIVFIISGLWHGASWTFVIWGLIHGVFYIIENSTEKIRSRFWSALNANNSFLHKLTNWFFTMSIVLFGWIFFRSNSIEDSLTILTKIFSDLFNLQIIDFTFSHLLIELNFDLSFFIIFFAILILEINHFLEEKFNFDLFNIPRQSFFLKFAIVNSIVFMILLFGNYQTSEFIYFQF